MKPTTEYNDVMSRPLQNLVSAALLAAACTCAHAAAPPESYPTKPIRFITPFAPGGGTDVVARTVSKYLTEQWGQTVVVDNRPGGNTILATELAVRGPSDGYTILMVAASFSVNPSVKRNLPYDPLRDLTAVTQTAFQPYVLVVHPSLPVQNAKQFIAYAQSKGDTLNFGGPGTQSHLAVELFKMLTNTRMVHVPYKGAALAMTDLIGGQIQLMYATTLTVAPHVKSGRLRSLAVTSAKRSSALPDLPTLQESGVPGYDVSAWNGIMVNSKVSPAIIARLNRDIVKALAAPEVKEKLLADGAEPAGGSPEDFMKLIRTEIATWQKVVKAAGIPQE